MNEETNRRADYSMRAIPLLVLGLLVVGTTIANGAPRMQIDMSHARGVQNEASIAVNPADSRQLIAASQDLSICGIRVYSSADSGRTWSTAAMPVADATATRAALGPSRFCAVNQWVAADRSGRQYVVFLHGATFAPQFAKTVGVYFSSRAGGGSWATPRRIDTAATQPAYDDKPTLIADTSSVSPYAGRLYVAWTLWANRTESQVLIQRSDDQGETWSAPLAIAQAPFGGWGVHLATGRDGTLYATAWSGVNLWISRSTNGGSSFQPLHNYVSLAHFSQGGASYVSAEPTQPIQPAPSLAVDASSGSRAGSVYSAYSRPSVSGGRVVVNILDSDLRIESARTIAVGPKRGVYDEFNPAVAVDENSGTVWTCFYLSGVGKQRKLATYSCVNSHDRGQTWSKVLGGASVASDETAPGAFNRPGRVDNNYASYEGLAVANGVAHPIWTDTRNLVNKKEEIYTTSIP